MNKKLDLLNRKINKKNAYLDDFATLTSHNLREPIIALEELSKLTNYISTEKDFTNDDLKQLYNSSIEKLNDGINILVQFYDFIDNEENINNRKTLISKSIEETCERLEHLEPKNTKFIKSIKSDILLNKTHIDGILEILIINAYNHKKDTIPLEIKITAYKSNNIYNIFFKDNGKGVDLSYFKRILLQTNIKFLNKNELPTTFSLNSLKRHVRKLNGQIDICSKPNLGTVVKIKIKTPNV